MGSADGFGGCYCIFVSAVLWAHWPRDISVTAPAPVVNIPIEGSAGGPFWEPGASHLCSSQGLVETTHWGVGDF